MGLEVQNLDIYEINSLPITCKSFWFIYSSMMYILILPYKGLYAMFFNQASQNYLLALH